MHYHVAINYFNCILIFSFGQVIMLKFVLLVNKQGQTRLSQYYEYSTVEERVIMEADIIRKCLARSDEQVTIKFIMNSQRTHHI